MSKPADEKPEGKSYDSPNAGDSFQTSAPPAERFPANPPALTKAGELQKP
jgi:hypothetical protein